MKQFLKKALAVVTLIFGIFKITAGTTKIIKSFEVLAAQKK